MLGCRSLEPALSYPLREHGRPGVLWRPPPQDAPAARPCTRAFVCAHTHTHTCTRARVRACTPAGDVTSRCTGVSRDLCLLSPNYSQPCRRRSTNVLQAGSLKSWRSGGGAPGRQAAPPLLSEGLDSQQSGEGGWGSRPAGQGPLRSHPGWRGPRRPCWCPRCGAQAVPPWSSCVAGVLPLGSPRAAAGVS